MNLFSALVLGIVQGLTEFLPVSSSGHLVIFQKLIPGFYQPGILFDVILHFGTLLAVLVYFRKNLVRYMKLAYLKLLIAGTVPAVLAGLLFRDQFEQMFLSVWFAGLTLVITGILNLAMDKLNTRGIKLNIKYSFIIGIAQAIAIIPGISRSGSTIFTGTALGIDREKVTEFSFILSVPAILGANILQLFTYGKVSDINPGLYFTGFAVAALVGYFSIRVVFDFVSRKNFRYFGYYCIVLGIITLLSL